MRQLYQLAPLLFITLMSSCEPESEQPLNLDYDNDGVLNENDAFPNNASEHSDLDNDGIGDNSDSDRDGDGALNEDDKFPDDATKQFDLDNDGIEDSVDADRDGDGVLNENDVFPDDASEHSDLDNDGIGDNSDSDRDGDGVENALDAFANDPLEWGDFDNDLIGDNSDPDIDNDGIANAEDEFVYYHADLDPCATPDGLNIHNIESTIDWINAMPKPVKLDCFVASLPRPILINGTRNGISAQPAVGARSPRIFINIYNTDLLLSVVPDQNRDPELDAIDEEHPLELSFLTSETTSIKGEILFPVTQNLSYGAPYDQINLENGGTVCRSCHADETSAGFFDDSEYFVSQALKPFVDSRVTLTAMKAEHANCVVEDEPFRCAIYSSLFDHGSVFGYNFPDVMSEFK